MEAIWTMKFSKSPLKIFSVERDKKKIWRSRFSHLILEQIYFNVSNIPRSLWMSSSLICANTKSRGKRACNQATEKAVPFRPLKKSIIKPYCINFWILFLCHWICTSTFSLSCWNPPFTTDVYFLSAALWHIVRSTAKIIFP